MRLLFLGTYGPGRSPSQRYRFEQFQPHLKSRGFTVDYAGALSPTDAAIFASAASPAAKAAVSLKALATRALSLLPLPPPDVVFVQREAFFLFNHWAEWLASLQAPVVFDFDDAIWIHAVSEANARFAFLKNVEKVPRIVKLAHTVLAGNDHLADWARPLNPNVHVIPTVVDTDVFRPPVTRPTLGPVTIGWSGSPSTIAHLRQALPVLERVKARLGDKVRIRVMGDPNFAYQPLQLRGEAWNPDAELRFLQDMDIGLMPLPDDEWTRGKCGLKGLTSMASGAATVMSPVGVNTTIVEDGVTGFLPATDDAWVEVLIRLVEDASLRRRVGEAGRARVVADYSVARWKDPLADLLLRAATRGA